MKLILHIGTHKTASTSMQHFCALNREILQSYSIHYPSHHDSAYVFNFLASRLANNKEQEVYTFLNQAYKDAKSSECDTVLISAESFYAMTAFFLLTHDKRIPKDDYWSNERKLIETLKKCAKDFEEFEIYCYLRPQDSLASSLYNQYVKNVYGITEDYLTFIKKILPLFDYKKHIDLWADAFGQDNIHLIAFNSCEKSPVEDFASRVVAKDCYQSALMPKIHTNVRLCRDVLEFKREHNALPKDRSLAFVTVRCFHKLANAYEDLPGYQTFATYKEREQLFADAFKGNVLLAQKYGCAEISALNAQQDPTYPGLSESRKHEIKRKFQSLFYTPQNIIELCLRRFINTLIDANILKGALLNNMRNLANHIRLVTLKW